MAVWRMPDAEAPWPVGGKLVPPLRVTGVLGMRAGAVLRVTGVPGE